MFRGLLKLHVSYGLQIRRSAYSGPCHEAPTQPVTRLSRSLATQSYRFLLGWDSHPLMNCAILAHGCIHQAMNRPLAKCLRIHQQLERQEAFGTYSLSLIHNTPCVRRQQAVLFLWSSEHVFV